MPTTAPYGTWTSPLSVDAVTQSAVTFSSISVDVSTGTIYHTESRAAEKGRSVPVKRSLSNLGDEKDVFGKGWNARTGVHEYGGIAMASKGGVVWFSDYGTSRVYSIKDGVVEGFTPESAVHRFADFQPHPKIPDLLVSVLEDHTHPAPADVVNSIVLLQAGQVPQIIASGADFYSFPRWNTDGKWLAWTQWMHPNMPWDGSELRVAEVQKEGNNVIVGEGKTVAGTEGKISITDLVWASEALLLFQCDVSGFYNPWSYNVVTALAKPLLPNSFHEEFAWPAWYFGNSSIAPLTPSDFVVTSTSEGIDHLYHLIVSPAQSLKPLVSPFVAISHLQALSPTQVVFLGATNCSAKSLILMTFSGTAALPTTTHSFRTIKSPSSTPLPKEFFAPAVPQTLSTSDGDVHALYYPPTNPDFIGPAGEKPPAIISVHGGPTARAEPGLSLTSQFFTTRGYAWVDVNYGGSTGYGRLYRDRLNGQWGVVDVQDCNASVTALGALGLVDASRVAIRGSSAGGFTVLAALCAAPDTYAAGTSLYGVSDIAKLAEDTHKFEMRYMEKLEGGTLEQVPEAYHVRSPINNAQSIKAPLLLFQGSIDAVVPPSQAELIVEKIKERGGKVEYVVFQGEGHGWKKAETMKLALEKELAWYDAVFGFAKQG